MGGGVRLWVVRGESNNATHNMHDILISWQLNHGRRHQRPRLLTCSATVTLMLPFMANETRAIASSAGLRAMTCAGSAAAGAHACSDGHLPVMEGQPLAQRVGDEGDGGRSRG